MKSERSQHSWTSDTSSPRNARAFLFVVTGSSAGKLNRGGANLLAGRAVVRKLFPISEAELKEDYDLDSTLRWGTLSRIVTQSNDARDDEIRAYASTYLKENIVSEQLIRKIDPFRRFLQVAAQMNGKILNLSLSRNRIVKMVEAGRFAGLEGGIRPLEALGVSSLLPSAEGTIAARVEPR
jgi:predicted AAA+ superfamily ATPase